MSGEDLLPSYGCFYCVCDGSASPAISNFFRCQKMGYKPAKQDTTNVSCMHLSFSRVWLIQ